MPACETRHTEARARTLKHAPRGQLTSSVNDWKFLYTFKALSGLQGAGVSVPEDMSVIGFDDIPFARYLVPSLTTVAQPSEAIGRTCATLLFNLIDGVRPENNRFVLPHTLIVRSSTAPPP